MVMTSQEPGATTGTDPLDPAWEVRDLRHSFGGETAVPVLDGISLRAQPGEFVSLVGPSGCGKSTVLRVLAGLLMPDGGSATVAGTDVAGLPGFCAFQPQRPTLLPWRRCLDNAVTGAVVAGVPREEAIAAAQAQWARFGLAGYERSWPSELSGGMKQRLALLRAFLVPKPVLLLDEPLGALDAITRRDLQGWLEGVWAEDGRTVLLVTHDVEEALLLSDRVVVLSDRPARVMADVTVDLPRPRPDTVVTDPFFVRLRGRVLEALRAGHRLG
jgi:ABC-type nitrate/sulfonate/bicarbonate transport system ATPase subunit